MGRAQSGAGPRRNDRISVRPTRLRLLFSSLLAAFAGALPRRLAKEPSRWLPELELYELRRAAPRSAPASEASDPVYVEMERSIRDFQRIHGDANATSTMLEAMLKEHMDAVVLVLGNRVFLSNVHELKLKKQAYMVAGIARKLGLPNVLFLHSSASSGGPNGGGKCYRANRGHRDLPTTVIGKRWGYGQCGLLVPNPYFGYGNLDKWATNLTNYEAAAASRPFQGRDKRVLWRGVLKQRAPCDRDGGNFARLSALALTKERPQLFDVKCSGVCLPRNETLKPCASLPYDPGMAAAAADVPQSDAWVKSESYADHAYLLNLPGESSGSYSRNLNHLWSMGSVVFLWDVRLVEFYYPGLKDGETHVSLRRATAAASVERVRNDAALEQSLVEGSRGVAKKLVCAGCIERYYKAALLGLRERSKQGDVLDHRKSVKRLLRHTNCEKLFEVVPSGDDFQLAKVDNCDDVLKRAGRRRTA
ncbi:hypothetical protein M885DRAFT_510425 [Pelagophyceae sp. CCMP2097]|nr:hypothetical protein M885DRAFT_510425 [Pelagophyceae sp. CCMP2097]